MAASRNPLFPSNDEQPDDQVKSPEGYLLPDKPSRIEPLPGGEGVRQKINPAADLIRQKVERLYDENEPDAQQEANEAEHAAVKSPHQQFMLELTTSGKSLAEIQTEWHNYYVNLPNEQKHEVWQEFYDSSNVANRYSESSQTTPKNQPAPVESSPEKAEADKEKVVVADHAPAPEIQQKPKAKAVKPKKAKAKSAQATNEIKQKITKKVKTRADKLSSKISHKHKQNFHSLMFGLGSGFVVLAILMFGFFNQIIIAPFIQPGRADAAPIIIDKASLAADGQPKVIIPKISVEIPVIYDIDSTNEAVIQNNLLDGTIHYPTTEVPGEKGNVAIFGHSSNNIFNKGDYKFAFVLLHNLREGDIFYLTYEGQVYSYKVFKKQIVEPTEVSVLNDVPGQVATATLITCDPPGTSLHRLVVTGKQISPQPSTNSPGNDQDITPATQPDQLAGPGPSLWSRFWSWLF